MMQTLIGIAVIVMVPLGAVKWTGWYANRCVQNARDCVTALQRQSNADLIELDRLIAELDEVSGGLRSLREN